MLFTLKLKHINGFTFLELLIIISITGIISLISYPYLNTLKKDYILYKETSDLLMRLQNARDIAIRDNCVINAVFKTSESKYIIFEDTNNDNSFNTGDRKIIEHILHSDAYMYEASFGTGQNQTKFDQRGSSSHLGHVYFKNSGGKYKGIVVRSLAGNIVIKSSHDGKTWN
ncbi:MAG: hypothetical protein GY760_08170 [Deltaproteobacteria bacterium]|nr:hypothetical protein [Deltaproteobacteria bacterium]